MGKVGGNLLARLRRPKDVEVFERRRSARTATVFQLAKITSHGREELCMVRDVSPTGMKAQVYHAIEVGSAIAIELKTGHALSGRVVWADAPFIGVQFDTQVEVQEMLAHCAFDYRLARMRPPRIDTNLLATVTVYGVPLEVRVTNLSLAGLAIETDLVLPQDEVCHITLPGLDPLKAVVRWSRGSEAGLQLDAPIDFFDFATWRAGLLAA